MSVALDIATVLDSAMALTVGTNLFYGRRLSDTPDTQVAVQVYGGLAPARTMTATVGSVIAERPRCQVVSRAADYATAETNAQLAWDALQNYKGTVNGNVYLDMTCLQSPFWMGTDGMNRCLMGFNVDIYLSS
jgi:hypothetical protein